MIITTDRWQEAGFNGKKSRTQKKTLKKTTPKATSKKEPAKKR